MLKAITDASGINAQFWHLTAKEYEATLIKLNVPPKIAGNLYHIFV